LLLLLYYVINALVTFAAEALPPFYYDLDTLTENAHYHLFKHSCRQDHCLYHLYSVKPRPPGAMRLRTRGHDFELPIIKYEINKRNFIVQSLFFLIMSDFVFYCIIFILYFIVHMCECHMC